MKTHWMWLSLFSVICACSAGTQNSTAPENPQPNMGEFPKIDYPADNPYSVKAVALGKKLFFDPILSVDNTVSCSSCHDPVTTFTDANRFSNGVLGGVGTRHSMPVVNVAWGLSFFWDGRAASLEEQALGPVENPIEMGETWPNVVNKLQVHTEYPNLFLDAYGTSILTKELVAKAIAQYERTLNSNNSKYDRYLKGEETLTAQEIEGLNLFFSERTECFHCHSTILFTDFGFHNNGLDLVPTDLGLGGVTNKTIDNGKFKTPTLRNVEYRNHFMHDGRFSNLTEVIDHYDSGVQNTANLDPLFQNGRSLNLSASEKLALIEFLKTLSDSSFIQEHSP